MNDPETKTMTPVTPPKRWRLGHSIGPFTSSPSPLHEIRSLMRQRVMSRRAFAFLSEPAMPADGHEAGACAGSPMRRSGLAPTRMFELSCRVTAANLHDCSDPLRPAARRGCEMAVMRGRPLVRLRPPRRRVRSGRRPRTARCPSRPPRGRRSGAVRGPSRVPGS